jgi:hypothetical protein
MKRYRITRLPNGLYELYDYHCQWSGCYNEDGTFRHGQTSNIKNLNMISASQLVG